MKLSKIGYPTGRSLRIGQVPDGNDYPRWGYLDKLETNAIMPKAFCIAAALFLGGVGGWRGWTALRVWRLENQVQDLSHAPTRTVKVLTAAEIGVPPSLMQTQVTAVKIDVKLVPKVAMPVPVPDDQAVEETIATVDEIAIANARYTDLGFGAGTGDSLVFDAGDVARPSPDEYVPFEKAPQLIQLDPPKYPPVAREAGIEGTVLVRVLVGDDGFVKDLYVIQTIPMLNRAAADAAWNAVFKPALQKHNPVAVWMVIPIVFSLKDREARSLP
jgi:protein TonB